MILLVSIPILLAIKVVILRVRLALEISFLDFESFYFGKVTSR